MPNDFTPICIDDRDKYLELLAKCPQKASDYSFANLWGWAEEYGLEWSFGQEHVWVRQTKPRTVLWAPIGPWNTVNWAECPRLAKGQTLTRVPEVLAKIWQEALGERCSLSEAREHWDYLYSVPELISLAGNKFHKKKNLLAQFRKNIDANYSSMGADCVEEVLDMQRHWCTWRDCEDQGVLMAENQAIYRVLTSWDRLPGLLGGTIRVNGNVVAYTVAEPLDEQTLVIHFEKAHTEYKGIYQAINQMFLAREAQAFALVNREQDLGDEGLRKAKLSYNPVEFLRKFSVSVAEK